MADEADGPGREDWRPAEHAASPRPADPGPADAAAAAAWQPSLVFRVAAAAAARGRAATPEEPDEPEGA